MQYEDYQHQKVHFIGSVAFYYKEVLAEAAKEIGIQLVQSSRAPWKDSSNITTESDKS